MEIKKRTNGIYFLAYKDPKTGRLVRKSLGTRDEVEAKTRAMEYLNGKDSRKLHIYTVGQALDRAYTRRWSKQKSAHERLYDVNAVKARFMDTPVDAVTTRLVREWTEVMEEAGLSASTIQRRISTLSTALEIACEDEKLDSVPKLPYPTRKRGKAPVYIKTEEEEDRLRAELLSLDRPTNPTNNGGHPWLPGTGTVLALVADILLQTGMRVSELILARRADLVGNTLVLNQQKSGSPGSVPLNADAREYLKRLWDHPTWWRVVKGTLDERGNVVEEERRRAYKWIEYRFRPAAKRAGLGDITLHKLRHTAASRMITRGVPIYEVQKVLRHSSTEVTQIYAHLSADHLQDAVATLSRRKPGEAKESNVVELRRNTA